MNLDQLTGRFAAIVFCLTFLMGSPAAIVGQIVEPRVVAGSGLSAATQKNLGLVSVGNCSGTLLNQYWVLTARHCVTVDANVETAFPPPNQIRITAAWSSKTAIVSRFHDFSINSASGSARNRDIVLLYLGDNNFGQPAATQKMFVVARDGKISGRLRDTDTVTQFGRGYSTFATDLKTPSGGAGTYRSAVFNPSTITATHYNLVMTSGASGHGGDSGGPSVVTIYGQTNGGLAGVQSTCQATGHVTGAPIKNWDWATGINFCTYVSTEPFLSEISTAIKEAPLNTPYITASQAFFLTPTFPYASVILAWDGGPAYPSVQVYVSVNKGTDIPAFSLDFPSGHPLFKQPKAGGEHKLPRSSGHYRYLLKSGGSTLAFADVYVP